MGALARFGVARLLPTTSDGFPTATFVTNVIGAFLLGLLLEQLARRGAGAAVRHETRLLLGTGLLGAFTTYSTLAVEVTLLGRAGRFGLAVGYGMGSALAGLAAAALGLLAASRMPPS